MYNKSLPVHSLAARVRQVLYAMTQRSKAVVVDPVPNLGESQTLKIEGTLILHLQHDMHGDRTKPSIHSATSVILYIVIIGNPAAVSSR